MSHTYQPVMLIEILKQDGNASVNDIAKALLGYDTYQSEYYEQTTKNMVGKVAKQMTPTQIEIAQRLARECVGKNNKACGE